jgi:hypothetical protein
MSKAMKPRHWLNVIVILVSACLLTYLAMHWAITSYVEPTCRRYAESKGMSYIGYIPLDPTINASHSVYEGDCQLRASNGEVKTVTLLKASGTRYGAPVLVGLALSWHLVFIASFLGSALILSILIRAVTGKPAS